MIRYLFLLLPLTIAGCVGSDNEANDESETSSLEALVFPDDNTTVAAGAIRPIEDGTIYNPEIPESPVTGSAL